MNMPPTNQNDDLSFEPFINKLTTLNPNFGMNTTNPDMMNTSNMPDMTNMTNMPDMMNMPNFLNPSMQYIPNEANPSANFPPTGLSSQSPMYEAESYSQDQQFPNQFPSQFEGNPQWMNAYEGNENSLRLPPFYWFTPLFNYYHNPYLNHNHGFYPYMHLNNNHHHHHHDYGFNENYQHFNRGIDDTADRIENENEDLFHIFEYYIIPYPVAKDLVGKIVSLTLKYNE